MASTVALALAALVLYGARGNVGFTLWVYLNLLDSLRALKVVRSNGRRIGVVTRRNRIRQSVVCWIILVAVQPVGFFADLFLSWVPFYGSLKTLVVLVGLTWRLETSAFLLQTFVIPFIRRYETDIDLVLSFVGSMGYLLLHYFVHLPWHLVSVSTRSLWRSSTSTTPTGSRVTADDPPRVFIKRPRTELGPSSDDEYSPGPSSSKPKLSQKTPSKPPKSSLRVPELEHGVQRRSPRRPSPGPLYPDIEEPKKDRPKPAKTAKPSTKRADQPVASHAAAATSKSSSTTSKRPAPSGSRSTAVRRKEQPSAEGKSGAASSSTGASNKATKPTAASRRAAATEALLALPHPPAGDPGSKSSDGDSQVASSSRTKTATKKRSRRGEDEEVPATKRVAVRAKTGEAAPARTRATSTRQRQATKASAPNVPKESPARKRTREAPPATTDSAPKPKRTRTTKQ